MSFRVVCQKCGQLLYASRDMVYLYRLGRKTDEKCFSCNRKISIDPLRIKIERYDKKQVWVMSDNRDALKIT